MKVKVWVYELPPCDYFQGFVEFEDFRNEWAREMGHNDGIVYDHQTAAEVEAWRDECLALIRAHTHWEGDGEMWVSAIPSQDPPEPLLVFTVKQSNNGSTYVVSQFELPEAAHNPMPCLVWTGLMPGLWG